MQILECKWSFIWIENICRNVWVSIHILYNICVHWKGVRKPILFPTSKIVVLKYHLPLKKTRTFFSSQDRKCAEWTWNDFIKQKAKKLWKTTNIISKCFRSQLEEALTKGQRWYNLNFNMVKNCSYLKAIKYV